MKITIGSSLKSLRLQKGITQEQAAEAFGVSPQAVSRWENDSAYPDITLLPGIAMFYGTTTDHLLGMDALLQAEQLGAVHAKVQKLVLEEQSPAAAALLQENLRLYPGNTGLMLALAETLAQDPSQTEKAVSAAEQVLQKPDLSLKARCTATATLLFLYRKLGQTEKAARLLTSLPHLWESRELLRPELASAEEYPSSLQTAVLQTLSFLCSRIQATLTRDPASIPQHIQLGADLSCRQTPDEMLEQLRLFLQS